MFSEATNVRGSVERNGNTLKMCVFKLSYSMNSMLIDSINQYKLGSWNENVSVKRRHMAQIPEFGLLIVYLVLGQMPLRKIYPNPDPNANPNFNPYRGQFSSGAIVWKLVYFNQRFYKYFRLKVSFTLYFAMIRFGSSPHCASRLKEINIFDNSDRAKNLLINKNGKKREILKLSYS